MARRKIGGGLTSATLPVSVKDTSSTTGAGLAGLVFNTAGLVAEYRRQGQSTWTAITLVAGTLGTYVNSGGAGTGGGFVADGSQAGDYEVSLPDAMLASGARWVLFRLRGAANMLPVRVEVELDAVNYQDGVRLGLTALPNAPSGSAGAVLTAGVGTAQLNVNAGVGDSNTKQVNGVATSTSDGTAQAGGASTITLASGDTAGTNAYVDRIISIVSGMGIGQSRYISAYNSATKVATVHRAWDTNPDNTSQYAINDTAAALVPGNVLGITGVTLPAVVPSLAQIQAGLPTAAQIVTALMSTSVNGHTYVDIQAALAAYHMGNITSVTKNVGAKTITVVYVDGAVTYTSVQSFSDSALTIETGKTITITGLP